MDVILASKDGEEEGFLRYSFDFEIGVGASNDFAFSVPLMDWDGSISFGKRIYIPDTEFGGVIGETKKADDAVTVTGYTWRGLLEHKILQPPSGSDYFTVSGDLNSCIASAVNNACSGIYQASVKTTGVTTSYQFDRYTDFITGITSLLKTKNYKPVIRYTDGTVVISAEKIVTGGDITNEAIEFSPHYYKRGVNHYICLGQGKLKDRTVVHLYADAKGNISQKQTFTGTDEIVKVFDDISAQDETELIKNATDNFEKDLDYVEFGAEASSSIDMDLQIGDRAYGYNYELGQVQEIPIAKKILKIEKELATVEYKLEGET